MSSCNLSRAAIRGRAAPADPSCAAWDPLGQPSRHGLAVRPDRAVFEAVADSLPHARRPLGPRSIRCLALAVVLIGLAPTQASADFIDLSDFQLRTNSLFRSALVPDVVSVSDSKLAPRLSDVKAETLLPIAEARPVPGVPTTQQTGFSSAAADGTGAFAVGVNGFFTFGTPVTFSGREMRASGNITGSLTNNLDAPVNMAVNFSVPEPTLRFVGVGEFPVPGINAARLATAQASFTIVTTLFHPDGSSEGPEIVFDYGLQTLREPLAGSLLVFPASPESVGLERFGSPGNFGFRLPALDVRNFFIGEVGPGERREFFYTFQAVAGTSIGEQGVFAAIGDPFNLSAGGGRFDVQVTDVTIPPPTAVPEPSMLATLLAGATILIGASFFRQSVSQAG